ncbi:hypothetical protein GCM10010921_19890 [Microbacterium album]|uniref:Uncharacterized protein n=1 Tax=Microbacterium album TaxID=2053191 RepID=A0A917MLV3_9MICO|nr:hypothetical protein GCM10010921_19890 [Microbacterium album]
MTARREELAAWFEGGTHNLRTLERLSLRASGSEGRRAGLPSLLLTEPRAVLADPNPDALSTAEVIDPMNRKQSARIESGFQVTGGRARVWRELPVATVAVALKTRKHAS